MLSLSVGATLLGRVAHAQAPSPALACEPLAKQLVASKSELESALAELRAAQVREKDAVAMRSELARVARELGEKVAALGACQLAASNQCANTNSFVRGLATGRVRSKGAVECVAPDDQRVLLEELSGWARASVALGELAAFSGGENDTGPVSAARLGNGSKVERLVARLFAPGNGSPLTYRRLLVEALLRIAPRYLGELRAHPGNLERWFASSDALDEALVGEAHEGATHPVPDAPQTHAGLATALELVSSYQVLARCSSPQPARDCGRARQLNQMLESSSPLILRSRMQEIWASECSSLSDGAVRAWLADLPRVRTSDTQSDALAQAVHSKLFGCFLRDPTAGNSFSAWLPTQLPKPASLPVNTQRRLLGLEHLWQPGSATDLCVRAARALQTLPAPQHCEAPPGLVAEVEAWSAAAGHADAEPSFASGMCDRLARSLWRGESATVPNAFAAPPTVDDAVRLLTAAPASNLARLRNVCENRLGQGPSFATAIRELGKLAQSLGESPALPPWNLDASTLEPVESMRARGGEGTGAWLASLANRGSACSLLGLDAERCRTCRDGSAAALYDCDLLQSVQSSWAAKTRAFVLASSFAAALLGLFWWALRLRRALAAHGAWYANASGYLRGIGLDPEPDGWRFLFPARFSRLLVALPATPAWERWGRRAVLVRSHGTKLQDRDVNRAGTAARASGAELALLVHGESASPDLAAVRAMLDWAARGAGKAVHVLALPWSRLEWSRAAGDLLELAEESSLRSNPFEVRGRVTSSTQFFNRERLVSGLLAGAQAGHFIVITGLRRFGKSSLALEVARRLPGPSAYVDLAGFHLEIHRSSEPADAADAILRFLCLKLLESARARTPQAEFALAVPEGRMDAATLSLWFRDFARLLAQNDSGRAPPALLILDEIEQAIGAAPELNRALEAFAIIVGRLKSCLLGPSHEGGQRVGVLFSSALHPLLWSPLATLAHQSLVGSFEYVAVPCLPDDVAGQMMRGLGSRQGIRFADAALDLLVRESQGVPLLLRRLGSSVLGLYDPERARQGSLGAVEIGVEGVRAALEREESDGSPVRVWVESEIAEAGSPGGVVLRSLAQTGRAGAKQLRAIAARAFRHQFDVTGVSLALSAGEADRRAEEAAAVVVRTLGESGLLRAHGDPNEPEAYELPDGLIRRVLRNAAKALSDAPA